MVFIIPRPDGQTALYLTPLEFLDQLAALIPPPRKHRHRYHGVLAPHSPLRPAVTAYAGLPMDAPAGPPQAPAPPPDDATEPSGFSPARYLWAVLIARIYEILPLICPVCGSEMRLIAAVTERQPVQRILCYLGEPPLPPPISPARSPPLWDTVDWDQTPGADPENGEPAPEFQFDQTSVGNLADSHTLSRLAHRSRRPPYVTASWNRPRSRGHAFWWSTFLVWNPIPDRSRALTRLDQAQWWAHSLPP